MQKELLLAIGDDMAASYNLRFLKDTFEDFCDLRLTLFYVSPRMATWDKQGHTKMPDSEALNGLMAQKLSAGEQTLESATRWIGEIAGCGLDNVTTKVVHSRKGTVRELIDEAREGLYDALLLGRKGFTWFEEVFENSVCHELLWQDIDFPIWVCRRPQDNKRRDVLLCMDGSEASLRIVDHAAYMLANEKKHTFTLFHVASDYQSGRAGRIFDEGLAILAENGVEEERIELKMVTSKSPVASVIKEATEGNYGIVAVGKHWAEAPSKMKDMFPSSLVVKLLRQMTDCALWVSK